MAPETLADLPYAASLSPHQGPLAADTDYDGVHFDGLDLAAPRGAASRFMECAFTKVTVQDGRFRRARFNDVWLSGVRLTATELTETAWTDAIWSGSCRCRGDHGRSRAAPGHAAQLQAGPG